MNNFKFEKNDDMDLRNVMDVMREFKDAAPSVGIFWIDEDTETLAGVQAAQVDFKSPTKGCEMHRNTHKTYWQKQHARNLALKNRGLKHDEFFIQEDYTQIPRGIVFYDWDTEKFFVKVGFWYANFSWLRKAIVEEFDIPDNFEFQVDERWELGHEWLER